MKIASYEIINKTETTLAKALINSASKHITDEVNCQVTGRRLIIYSDKTGLLLDADMESEDGSVSIDVYEVKWRKNANRKLRIVQDQRN
jgi:hypothetical protein